MRSRYQIEVVVVSDTDPADWDFEKHMKPPPDAVVEGIDVRAASPVGDEVPPAASEDGLTS